MHTREVLVVVLGRVGRALKGHLGSGALLGHFATRHMDSSQRLRGRRVQALVVLASQRAPATKPQMKSLWWARRKLLPPSKARSETEETSFLNQARHQMLSDEDVVKAKASVCIWHYALLKESQTCPCGGFKADGRAMWSSSQSMTSQSRTIHTHSHSLTHRSCTFPFNILAMGIIV